MWQRLSDSLSWSQGHQGRGYLLHDGTIKTWNVDPFLPLEHREVWERNHESSPSALNFEIDPDGGVVTTEPTTKALAIVNADPRLYDAGQRPVFEDDFDLDKFTPHAEQEGKPDLNFIMSASEDWEPETEEMFECPRCHRAGLDDVGRCQACGYTIPYDGWEILEGDGIESPVPGWKAVGWGGPALDDEDVPRALLGEPRFGALSSGAHRNPWTGQVCHCAWGRPKPLRRTAGVNMRKLLKAPDRVYRTPQGKAFLRYLKTLPEDYDDLLPYLAMRFKKGDIRYIAPGQEPGYPRPRLEYANGQYYDSVARDYKDAWLPVGARLSFWLQWFHARQHPARRGVNILDPNFSPRLLENRVREHQEALKEKRRRERWLDEYGPNATYGNAPYIVHRFGPEAGKYKGWHVVQLDAHQAEGDSQALGHCIGSDEQPYKYNIENNTIDAYSLRDAEGYPHVSWHINPSGGDIGHMQGKSGETKPEYRDLISQFNQHKGLRDEEGYEEELENPEAYDDYVHLPNPDDVDSYIAHVNGDADWPDDANVGENTEIISGDPEWDSIADDYLHGYGDSRFFQAISHNSWDRQQFARALEQRMDPQDQDERQQVQMWNSEGARSAEESVDLPPVPANEVGDYNSIRDEDDEPQPDNWDALAQDYLKYPEFYGEAADRDLMRQPHYEGPRDHQNAYQQFHKHLQDDAYYNDHLDEMHHALQQNINWNDPGHQLAIQWWNDAMPEHNIHPEPEPPAAPIPGQTYWDWPQPMLDYVAQPPDPRNWNLTESVPNSQPFHDPGRPYTSHWHFADEHQGYSNYDTFQVAVTYDNDRPLYDAVRQLVRNGGTPEQLRDWATSAVIAPINQSHLQDAQGWNAIPQDERLDHNYEAFRDRHGDDPKAMDLYHGLVGGPNVEDYNPSAHMIDPGLVNWQELWTDLCEELGMPVEQSPATFPQEWTARHGGYNWEGLGPMPPLRSIPAEPVADPRNNTEAVYQAIGEAMEQGDQDTAQWLYQFLPEDLRPHLSSMPNMLAPAVELKEWLADLGGEEPEAPSIHHDSEDDLIQSPAVSMADDLPYFPPANVPKEYKQSADLNTKTAMPAPEGWWEQYIQTHPFLYHGTSAWAAAKMKHNGVVPWDQLEEPTHNWVDDAGEDPAEHFFAPRPGHVYLTPDMDKAFDRAELAGANHESVPQIVAVDTAALQPHLVNPDEDDWPRMRDYWDLGNQGKSPYRSLGEAAEAEGWGNHPEDTQVTLGSFGNVAYRGTIPPEAVVPMQYHGDQQFMNSSGWRLPELVKTADSPINQADATNDPLGKNPAIIPSPHGNPDYLAASLCPHCQQEHRPDEPCPDSSVTQYEQSKRQWYNYDSNQIHGDPHGPGPGPDGLAQQQMDLGRRANFWEAYPEREISESLHDESWDPTGEFDMECPTCFRMNPDGTRGAPGRIPDEDPNNPLGWVPCPSCGAIDYDPTVRLNGPVRGGDAVYLPQFLHADDMTLPPGTEGDFGSRHEGAVDPSRAWEWLKAQDPRKLIAENPELFDSGLAAQSVQDALAEYSQERQPTPDISG